MNKFKNFKQINEADADEYVIDDDDFEQELTPNSKSEIEFVDLHKAVTIAHPVAGENQFKSDKDHAVTTGAESDNAEGEDKPIKQGTSGDSNFARFRNKISKAPSRKGDKSQGDLKAETVKEEVELEERVAAFNKDGEAVAMYRDIATAKKLKPGHLYMHIKTNDKNDDDESDYKAGAFSYGKAGYRAKVMNKEGKIVYIGSASYKSIDKAKGEAKEYAKSFAKNGKDQKMAINAVANYRKRNKPSIYELYKETEQLQEHYDIEEVISESVKPGAMKLKDGKSVKISDSDAKSFNDVMKKLNPENRKRMEAEMMKDHKSFKQMLSFVKSQD